MRIISLHWQGFKVSKISDILVLEDATVVLRQSIWIFLKHFKERDTIARKPGSGLPLNLSPTILKLIESAVRKDDQTTATQLLAKLAARGCYVSLTTILHNCQQLGLIYCNLAYCQLIRNENKQKQLEWARANLSNNFDDVIWCDESSIQLDCHQ